jgi:thymidylate kinase
MFKRKGFLICVLGLDGSGKTTHTKHLVKYLSEKGYTPKYVWAGNKPFFSYFLFGFTRFLGYWKATKADAFTDPLEFAPDRVRKSLSILVRTAFLIDFNLRISLKIKLPLALGKVIICDRYVYDIVMDLMLSDLHSPSWYKLLIRTVPTPDVAFFLDADQEVLCSRRSNFSKGVVIRKRKIYQKFARIFNFYQFNTQADFSINQGSIRKIVMAFLEKN